MTYDSGAHSSTTGPGPLRRAGLVGLLAVVGFAIGLLSLTSRQANAAPASVAGSVLTACNGEQNPGGAGVHCTITVMNYVTAAGTLAASPASTWTVTRCTGAAGEISPALLPAATCQTTTTPITGQPITTVQQCNGSGSGGGGGVSCTVTVSNHFSAAPAGVFAAATVYQCVSVPLTPGLACDPTAANNTAASVLTATVGQCNGSGNGGGLVPAVPLGSANCAVSTGSTTTVTLPVHVDQCNGSANGGGSFIKCTASVTNDVAPLANTPTSVPPTTSSTAIAPTATSIGTLTATATATATPTGTLTATPSGTLTATATATATATPTGTLTATPTGTLRATATPTGTLTATATFVSSTATGAATSRPTGVPNAPNTGSGGGDGGAPTWPITAAGALLVLAGAAITFAAQRKV